MKRKLLSIGMAISLACSSGLAQNKCGTPNNISVQKTAATNQLSSCVNIVNFVPTATTDTLFFYVNMHFFKHTNGTSGPYDNMTLQDCQNIINGINNGYRWLSPTDLPMTPPAAYIQDTKIRFKLKNFYMHADEMAFTSTNICNAYFSNTYGTSTEINVFNLGPQAAQAGCAPGATAIALSPTAICYGYWHYDFDNGTANWPYGNSGILIHELGHAVGNLYHTDYQQFPDFPAENSSNPAAWGWVDCKMDSVSNNIMGYNKCRNYLSPDQIANYYLGAHGQSNGVFSTINTTPLTNFCRYDSLHQSVYITSNQTWTSSRAVGGDLIVKAGYKLTLKCDVSLPAGGRVLVEPHATLIIDGGRLTSYCNTRWDGVQVWGDNTKNQTINVSTGLANYQGLVSIINGGTIENAGFGITTIKRDHNGNADWSKTGGIVQATGAVFRNNIKDVEFMSYNTAYSASYFKGCTFKIDNGYLSGGWSDARVSMFAIKYVSFLGNTFVNTNPAYPGCGLQSIDASYFVQDNGSVHNTFNGFQYGIYTQNSSVFAAASIVNAVFGGNSTGDIYLGSSNSAIVTGNTFNVNSATSVTTPDYGLYLDHCTGYTVKNNILNGVTGSNLHMGIYVNASGANANSIYNNTFTNLSQGLWAADQNQGSTGATGLIMNCNDFTNCLYNIGVQGISNISNAGVAQVQGLHSASNDPNQYVRNTYNTPSCGSTSGSQNKWYISNANAYGLTHASFNGTNYQPTPQPYCGSSLITVYQDPGTYNKTTYCPANPGGGCGAACRTAQINQNIKKYKLELNMNENDLHAPAHLSEAQQAIASQMNYERNELGILTNQRITGCLTDSAIQHPMDTVIAVLQERNLADWKKELVGAYIDKGDYSKAQQYLNLLKHESPENDNFCEFHQLLISIRQGAGGLYGSAGVKDQLAAIANNNSHECCVQARAILKQVYGIGSRETILMPELSETAGIQSEVKLAGDVRMYPNPASSFINIDYTIKDGETAVICLTDINGQVMKTLRLAQNSTTTTLNVADVQSGVYMVSLTKNGVLISNKKFVLIK